MKLTKEITKGNFLDKKGITLIALVVTIVVLLILAGVSINALFGNNGIISRAQDAKNVTNLSSLKDEIGIVIQSRNINKMAGLQLKSFKEELEEGISGDKIIEKIGNIEDTYYVTRGGTTVTVYDNGDIIDGKADIWDGTSKSKPTVDESKNWHIYTPEEMKYFEEFVNGKLTDEEKEGLEITDSTIVYLEKDIDMGARQENGALIAGTTWEPIGVDETGKFTGTFEGNNHTVRGIYVKKNGDFAGLFGVSDTIQNLTIADSYIEATGKCVGGIVGNVKEGRLLNCINKGIVTGNENRVGGIAGQFEGEKVENCINERLVTGGIEDNIGAVAGIVGNVTAGDIINCINKGTIISKGCLTGGIVGQFKGKKIQNCMNTGDVSSGKVSTGQMNIANSGGIVGQFKGEEIENCVNNGNLNSIGCDNGGICGIIGKDLTVTINQCINTGKIQIEGNTSGGICGVVEANSIVTIKKCINTGAIQTKGHPSGGICGGIKSASTTIERCVNIGNLQGTGGYRGGICGTITNNSSSAIKNCYNLGDVIEEASDVSDVSGIISCINQGFSGTISNNYNLGKIIIKGQNVKGIGGVIGYLSATNTENATIKNNYYKQGIVENADNDYGESKTEAEMKTEEFLALLNADQETPAWELNPSKNNGYPSLIGVDK